MKIEEIWAWNTPLPAVERKDMSEIELKKAAADFAAIFYEKVLGGMLKAYGGEKGFQEDLWMEMLTREIAREIARSPGASTEQFYNGLKKDAR